jgi:hypothetical protein
MLPRGRDSVCRIGLCVSRIVDRKEVDAQKNDSVQLLKWLLAFCCAIVRAIVDLTVLAHLPVLAEPLNQYIHCKSCSQFAFLIVDSETS